MESKTKPYRVKLRIAGLRFGLLTVIHKAHTDAHGNSYWLCQCDCGNKAHATSGMLKRANHPTRCCGCTRKSAKRGSLKARINGLIREYKKGAAARGYSFSLTFEEAQMLFCGDCHYCGQKPKAYNGIDRLDNGRGYEIGNCVSCCTVDNYNKGTMTYSAYVEHCARVAQHSQAPVCSRN